MAQAKTSKAAVLRAIFGNLAVTIGKGIAAFLSGSGAMLAETLHSLVDTLNQCLLLIGHYRSLRQPTNRYPYGFGPEAEFWGLLAAIGILGFGGGFSILHGLEAIAAPEVPDHIPLSLIVLAVSIFIEGYVLATVIRDLVVSREGRPWGAHLRSQGSGTITVLMEDAAAVVGCLIAMAALTATQLTNNGIFDGIAQLSIGVMLAMVGLTLVWRNRGALIGQSVSDIEMQRLRVFIEDLEGIDRVTGLKTRQLTPDSYMLKAEVVFSGGSLAQPIVKRFARKALKAKKEGEMFALLGRYADALFEEQARHVDVMEKRILDAFPGAVNIDLEPHLHEENSLPDHTRV